MRAHAVSAAVVGTLVLVWLGVTNADVLARPIAVVLLVTMAALVVAVTATYQWRTLLLVLTTAVLSGVALGLGLAVALLDPTAQLWGATVPFALAGFGAVWASHRRPARAGAPSGRRSDRVGSPAA